MRGVLRDVRSFISSKDLLVLAVGLALSTQFQKTLETVIDALVMPVVSWLTGRSHLASREARVPGTRIALAWGKALEAVLVFLVSLVVMVEIVKWLTTSIAGLRSTSVTWA